MENYEMAAFSERGTVRENNEDNLYCSRHDMINYNARDWSAAFQGKTFQEDLMVAAVFDGMGGMEGGELASLVAAQKMNKLMETLLLESCESAADISYVFSDLKKDMENELCGRLEEKEKMPGTTCCGFWRRRDVITPFWIGDSRLYLWREGNLTLLTQDHTVAQEKINGGLLTPQEARRSRSWHCLTAYIGDGNHEFSLGRRFRIRQGDKILLCTDGISDQFESEKLGERLAYSPRQFMESMVKELKKECRDNATAIMIEYL